MCLLRTGGASSDQLDAFDSASSALLSPTHQAVDGLKPTQQFAVAIRQLSSAREKISRDFHGLLDSLRSTILELQGDLRANLPQLMRDAILSGSNGSISSAHRTDSTPNAVPL